MKKQIMVLCAIGAVVVAGFTITSIVYHKENKADSEIISYPVTLPNNVAWGDLSIPEQRAAFDLPIEEVNAMSTDQILQLALAYPLRFDYLAYSGGEPSGGLKCMTEYSNVYKVLLERKDLKETIENIYDQYTPQEGDSEEAAARRSLDKLELDALLRYIDHGNDS